jgi:hypothetical protein
VVAELNVWLQEEPAKLSPLLTFLFLHRRGLFDLLDRYRWIPSFTTEPCSRYLLSAWEGEAEARELLKFLAAMLQGITFYPGIFRSLLRDRLLQTLKRWIREACEVLALRPVVLGLLVGLLEAEETTGGRAIFDFLKYDRELRVEGSRPRALAVEALTGGSWPRALIPRIERPRRAPRWFTVG